MQTHVLSGVEQVTALKLLPKYSYSNESMVHDVGNLVKVLRSATERMRSTQADYAEATNQLRNVITNMELPTGSFSGDIREIKELLRDGFRLPGEGK